MTGIPFNQITFESGQPGIQITKYTKDKHVRSSSEEFRDNISILVVGSMLQDKAMRRKSNYTDFV